MGKTKEPTQRNWKTTTLGIITLALTGLSIYSNPASAASPGTIAGITTGMGLILAQDARKKPAATTEAH